MSSTFCRFLSIMLFQFIMRSPINASKVTPHLTREVAV